MPVPSEFECLSPIGCVSHVTITVKKRKEQGGREAECRNDELDDVYRVCAWGDERESVRERCGSQGRLPIHEPRLRVTFALINRPKLKIH